MSRFVHDATGAVVSVADEKDYRFISGWKPAGGQRAAAPDKSWKVAELKEYAAEHDIDLGEATKKEDILDVLSK